MDLSLDHSFDVFDCTPALAKLVMFMLWKMCDMVHFSNVAAFFNKPNERMRNIQKITMTPSKAAVSVSGQDMSYMESTRLLCNGMLRSKELFNKI